MNIQKLIQRPRLTEQQVESICDEIEVYVVLTHAGHYANLTMSWRSMALATVIPDSAGKSKEEIRGSVEFQRTQDETALRMFDAVRDCQIARDVPE